MRVSTSEFNQSTTNTILDQQSQLLKTQNQLGTGKRILTPSDDPSGATRALNIDQALKSTEQFQRNNEQAELRLKQEDSTLDQVSNVTQRIRELTVQANNATQTENSRASIAAELRERREELVDLANSRDGRGEYLFAGFQSDSQPFVRDGGSVNYEGDQGQRDVQVGPSRTVKSSHNGFEAFMDIPTGDTDFLVSDGNYDPDTDPKPNEGGARLAAKSVSNDAESLPSGGYTIKFSETGTGDLEYRVEDSEEDLITDASGDPIEGPYVEGDPIDLGDGRTVTFEGTPEDEDAFDITEDRRQSIFETVDGIIESLESRGDDTADQARLATENFQALENLDAAIDSFSETRAETGARLNALEGESETNEAAKVDLETELSRVEDLNFAEAISRFQQQQAGLQAAQQSFAQIQNLSLFQFI